MKTISCSEPMNFNNSKDIYNRITTIKAELHELVKTFGMVHELTVAKSQELDLVVNEYMCSKQQF
ncbi:MULTISPECIES: aspartyl-phosphate phosphatase Spo0E family protein [Turicibacter]|uniref:Spo0E family sporulation regulatory protein-aspartic acid phosphatase n=2 Tax=Turicibacter sanguinis TaxID=154288 RepID=A0A173T472_9FIRM|nr:MULTISPECIES: aspartyl-phosphate phosphatase Spo0E family protein [Turicibacter]EFF63092.1 Spo0E like sporulation regulatory protein [Turicibacter sanguinis PC909]EGC91706.1 Spo0E-like sporulation regulatory protein [Turicibacter sp. HGF1]MBP3904170.1 aspartyl-phosphate phosphatase Spo0E family protein [Turicibacter sp.]MCU7190999.1 aspartyl-phosphate phosphatase Spo0E family protein [Turicibacter sanguinis]MCU7197092.1 aspartyl-phosphate phosphatase Spo0E family protein [Turicibacter sangu